VISARHDATPPRIVVIAGPTASGKTSVAVDLASRIGGELIGADSIQVYRGLDVGSAKPTHQELRGVRHHLLDVVDVHEHYDAAQYIAHADAAIANVRARGSLPIVVGGTGLYIRALVRGIAEGIPADPSVREALQTRARSSMETLAIMHQELSLVDPEYAAKIYVGDPIRIVRALEVYQVTGIPYSEHHRRHAAMPPRYNALFVAIDVERSTLVPRITARAKAMLAQGWEDEVRGLLARGVAHDSKPLRAVGYAEVVGCLRGEIAAGLLVESIVRSTKEFAKRQRTWFRGETGVSWRSLEALQTLEFSREAENFLRGESTNS
jgi:tRNA dimethylallyltransferase